MHTLNSFRRQQWQPPEWITFVKTIEEPDEIAISPHHATSTPYGFDFVIVMLEEENTFLVRQCIDSDKFTCTRRYSHGTTDGSLRLMRRPRRGGIAGRIEVISHGLLVCKATVIAVV